MTITTIGLDLAKNVFQVHGVDGRGVTALRKQLRRDQVTACPRRSKFDPPCRLNFDPGMGAGFVMAGCG